MLCQIIVGSQFQNFIFICRRASDNFDCYPKMSTHKNLYLTFLKVAHEKNGLQLV